MSTPLTHLKKSAAKHTPGPWIAVGAWVEHPRDDIPDICNCSPISMGQDEDGRDDRETCANARLIAAAPDLLAAIEGVMPFLHGDFWAGEKSDPFVDAARAAIAKARG